MTILVLAAVVDERQRSRVEIARLLAAEAALRESEERLRFAQQVASIGTFDWNIQTGVNTWTPELEAAGRACSVKMTNGRGHEPSREGP